MEVKETLKIIVAGQKQLAVDLLDILFKLPWVKVIGIIPDKENMQIMSRAYELNIPIYSLNESLPNFDVGLSAHFFSKIPSDVLNKAKIGWLGYHPSPLPLYKGKRSIKEQIENKEKIVGGTLFWLNENFDDGEIFSQEFVFSNYKVPIDLWINELAPIGLKLFINALFDIKNGKIVKQRQWRIEK